MDKAGLKLEICRNDRRSGLYMARWVGRARRCTKLTVDGGPRVESLYLHRRKADPRAETLPVARDTYCFRYCSDGSMTTRFKFCLN
jgi:hypothetical protein